MKEPRTKGIDDTVVEEIRGRLSAAEHEHSVRILYCCESGSRAWGFPSPDSDYDVRFLYAHRPDWYLSFDVERRRDVIEYPIVDDIDCGGWDVRKALYLFTRTNGALLEWLNSPIRYVERGTLAERLRALAPGAINDGRVRAAGRRSGARLDPSRDRPTPRPEEEHAGVGGRRRRTGDQRVRRRRDRSTRRVVSRPGASRPPRSRGDAGSIERHLPCRDPGGVPRISDLSVARPAVRHPCRHLPATTPKYPFG